MIRGASWLASRTSALQATSACPLAGSFDRGVNPGVQRVQARRPRLTVAPDEEGRRAVDTAQDAARKVLTNAGGESPGRQRVAQTVVRQADAVRESEDHRKAQRVAMGEQHGVHVPEETA